MNKIMLQHRKMFKQSKKQYQDGAQSSPQSESSLSKTLKISNTMPKQLLQFLVRQISILKDISLQCKNCHFDITIGRLNECIHLIEKKLSFVLSDNPEQYHDYIQDFYENQINGLRLELNQTKIQLDSRLKQIVSLRNAYQQLQKEKQRYEEQQGGLQSSRKSINASLEYYEQNTKLKKELDHCRALLVENTALIEQQSKAIQHLSAGLHKKQIQCQSLIEQHTNKAIGFDEYISQYHEETESMIKSLAAEQKNYQIQIKEMVMVKGRVLEQKVQLQKELEMKVEQIQLLTAKILDDEIAVAKLEKTVVLKDRLIDELHSELQATNGSLTRIGRKEDDYQRTYVQKCEQLAKLEERISIVNQTNQKLERKVLQLNKKLQDLEQQNSRISNEAQQYKTQLSRLQLEHKTVQQRYSQLESVSQKCEQELKRVQQTYQQLAVKTKQEKQAVKKQIMVEVNQLIALVQTKDSDIQNLAREKEQLEKDISRQKEGRKQVQENFGKMNLLMVEIQRKIQGLQEQNGLLNEAKNILQLELDKVVAENTRLSKQQCLLAKLQSQHQALKSQLQQFHNSSSSSQIQQSEAQQLQEELNQQRRQFKQVLNKKDFQLKQMESKIKILQQELRDTSKLFENQKFKMSLKIKQLQQLLKERYEFSSRLSQHSEHV